MFGKVDLKAQVESLSSDVSNLNADKLALEQRLEEALQTKEAVLVTNTSLKKQVSATKATLEALKFAHTKQIEDLQGSLDARGASRTPLAAIISRKHA